MATLLKCNAVFLHTPKTGGTFLRRLFIALDLIEFDFASDHSDMQRTLNVSKHYPGNSLLRSIQLGQRLEKKIASSYKFCFVRHPFDWYESYWRFMQDHAWRSFAPATSRSRFGFYKDPWFPTAELEKCGDADFQKFMDNCIRRHPGFLTHMFEAYTGPQIDYVGKQETLTADIRHVLDQLNVKYDPAVFDRVGKVNESKALKPVWKDEHKRLIVEAEKGIFGKYGYAE